jgi:adenosylcobinamide-GDP ribazoletransferase
MKHNKLLDWRDVAIALSLLSRWPLRLSESAYARSAQAVWAYPIAGALIGLPVAGFAIFCLWIGLPTGLSALLALAFLTATTGAMHEDGLADSADGLWGGHTAAQRLEIMKDSQIGTYGVLALIFGIGLRWLALTMLFDAGAVFGPILAAATLSRAVPPVLMRYLPAVRSSGLSKSVGRPEASHVGCAAATAIVFAVLALHGFPFVAFAGTILAGTGCAIIARSKVNGQTGDILGASQQVTEITVLLCLAL